jgi:hypothetical protein
MEISQMDALFFLYHTSFPCFLSISATLLSQITDDQMAKRKEDNPALHIKPAEPLNLQPWGFQI